MALTQQFARVSPRNLERCRASALDSPGAEPGCSPPEGDTLETDWARVSWTVPMSTTASADLLGCSPPPRLFRTSRALDEFDLGGVLASLPADSSAAAAGCGFRGFTGDWHSCPSRYFTLTSAFFRSLTRGRHVRSGLGGPRRPPQPVPTRR